MPMAKTIYQIQHKKNNRNRKKDVKDGKAFYQLMNNDVYG